MLFNSISFLIFFPIVTIVFFIIPRKIRYLWLLFTSYYFYMSWNPKFIVLILLVTVVTYLSGLLLQKLSSAGGEASRKQWGKLIVALSAGTCLSILGLFKYFNFFFDNLNALLATSGLSLLERPFDLILPVGISFYTFQALSYTIDVYRGETKVERNFFRYALFVTFFPQLVAGPIERSKNLLTQVQNADQCKWDYARVTDGCKIMVYGFFLKMVIADRVALLVDNVFAHYAGYGSTALILGAFFFAIQIYCDFSSYSLIAIGSAKVLGFELMENFNAPYFARSVAEFWRRWHISLSSWFRDYLYIPLGGSRCSAGRKYLNILVVFCVSGLWHGASWTFLVWGALNGIYQIVGEITAPGKRRLYAKCKVRTESIGYKIAQTVGTFILVDLGWIFFRSNTIRDALQYLKIVFTRIDPWTALYENAFQYGLSRIEFRIAIVAILFMAFVDHMKLVKKVDLHQALQTQCIWLRWGVYICLLVAIIVFGVYGPGFDVTEFLYFQF